MVEPLSIRVERPYASEEDFLDAEAWSITARSMLLIDIGPLPEGTALRCELRLSNGRPLVVAEGLAVKHLGASPTRPAGLVVRYKRMSAASSEFVKRAVARSAELRPSSPPKATTNPPVGQAKSVSTVPQRRTTSGPPPRPSRAPTVGQPSARPPGPGGRSSSPPRTMSGHQGPSAPTARSVSVVPAARRVSTIPPEPSTLRDSAKSSRPSPPQALVPSAETNHDTSAMQRLRSRTASRVISTPPDREAILSRLKKKPSR